MNTPLGIALQEGQRWQECDNRFTRIVVVTSWNEEKQRVQLNGRTWAHIKRFHGKRGGYKPV